MKRGNDEGGDAPVIGLVGWDYRAHGALSAKSAGTADRCHWHVEHTQHYIRHVAFQKDRSRIRHNPGAFATLLRFACTILRRNKTITFSQDRHVAAPQGLEPIP